VANDIPYVWPRVPRETVGKTAGPPMAAMAETGHAVTLRGPRRQSCRYDLRGFFGTNARNRRGLSTMIVCSTSSLAPAALTFGTNTVNVLP
jgi:hypothetical protein